MKRIDWRRANAFILVTLGALLLCAFVRGLFRVTGFAIDGFDVTVGIAVAVVVVRRVTLAR